MAIGSISGAAYQLQLQQTQRAAEQARQFARSLQTQASDAQAEADRAEQNANSLKIKAGRAQTTADQAAQNLQTVYTINQVKPILSNAYTRIAESQAQQNSTTPAPVTVSAAPTVGTHIDITA